MSENLYQAYRPNTFDKIVGQESILKDLRKRSENNSFAQSMLFEGITGVGKTSLQKIIAKQILCKNKDEKGNSCEVCEFCQTVNEEKISNYYFEKNASNLGIDEVRQLEEIATKKTLSNAQAKVIIIDEFQEISNQRAQKNILKLLEMPLKNVYFLIGAMNGEKIDRAIKARCIMYKLQPLQVPEIVKYLMFICKEENVILDTIEKKQVLIAIADNCGGSLRKAISDLERIIYSEIWNTQDLITELSIISNENLNEIVNQLLQGDINLLNNRVTDDILKRIKFILNILYKTENKLELNQWQKQQIVGIKKTSSAVLEHTISALNELIKFPYLPSDIIEFTLINVIKENRNRNRLTDAKPEAVRERPQRQERGK